MRILLLVALVAALFFAHRSCEAPRVGNVSRGTGGARSISGGALRQWEGEPADVMEMQDAIGNPGGSRGGAMRGAVKQGLEQHK